MMYLWIKSLHIVAVLLFTGGLILLAVVVSGWGLVQGVLLPHEKRVGIVVLSWDRWVTVPALVAVWMLGIGLTSLGGWMGQTWLFGKIAMVLVLSGLHGILAATLRRRLQGGISIKLSWIRYAPIAVAACSGAIAILVTMKP